MITKEKMIAHQLEGRDITDKRVLKAMSEIDRELFVPDNIKHKAYEDGPLPIGRGQTISQPYIVAYMSQALELEEGDRVLEIGTGCGYNAAVMSRLVTRVYSLEIIEWLSKLAKENLKKAQIENVEVYYRDGYRGLPEQAPFDKIMLTAAAPHVPAALKDQLKTGGKILAPIDTIQQKLVLVEKLPGDEYRENELLYVRFVPMTGESQN